MWATSFDALAVTCLLCVLSTPSTHGRRQLSSIECQKDFYYDDNVGRCEGCYTICDPFSEDGQTDIDACKEYCKANARRRNNNHHPSTTSVVPSSSTDGVTVPPGKETSAEEIPPDAQSESNSGGDNGNTAVFVFGNQKSGGRRTTSGEEARGSNDKYEIRMTVNGVQITVVIVVICVVAGAIFSMAVNVCWSTVTIRKSMEKLNSNFRNIRQERHITAFKGPFSDLDSLQHGVIHDSSRTSYYCDQKSKRQCPDMNCFDCKRVIDSDDRSYAVVPLEDTKEEVAVKS